MMLKVPETVALVVFTLLLVGCGSSDSNASDELRTTQAQRTLAPHDSPESAMRAFVAAWNASDFAGLVATFHPERRTLLLDRRADVESRIEAWKLDDPTIDTLCHPRGGGWKTTRFERVNLATSERVEDAAWLKLEDGQWWMYSL